MDYDRRFLTVLIILSAIVLSMLSGCASTNTTFDPYEVPTFVAVSDDFHDRSEQVKSKLDPSGDGFFRMNDIGQIDYSRLDSGEDFPIQMTDEEALRQAQEYLNELGLLPKDAYRTYVSRVNRFVMDLTGGAEAKPETVEIHVFFYWVFNGADVLSDEEDGIILSFDAQGICALRYLWRSIETSKISEDAKPISSEDAYHIYLDQWEIKHGTCCEPYENPEIFRAYVQFDGVSRPCWVIAEDIKYTNSWFVDMFTGEVLDG